MLGRMSPAARAVAVLGYVVVCVLAIAAPMLFGKPFGWFGRLWVLVAFVVYWSPWILLSGAGSTAANSQNPDAVPASELVKRDHAPEPPADPGAHRR